MSLHVPTILLALLLSVGMFALSLATARRYLREHDALNRWAHGTWCLAGGFVMLASRVVLPEWIAILVGNSLVAASLYLFGDSMHRFVRGRGAPRWQLALLSGAVVCLLLAARWPLPLRTSVLSVFYTAQLVPTVLLLAREGRQAERSLRTVGLALGLTGAALSVRAVHALLYPEQYGGFFAASLGNGLTYLASSLFPLGAGFGVLLAHLERTANQLQVLATHDALTGCANRGLFDAMLRHAVDRGHREGSALSLLLIDLDHFKQVNDRHGHPTGDRVLREVAQALRARLRASDVLARTGGEEFAVILPGTDLAGARRTAEMLRQTVATLPLRTAAGEPLSVTTSIGAATLAVGGATTPDLLYALADDVLYRAKSTGRNRWLHQTDLAAAPVDAPLDAPLEAPPTRDGTADAGGGDGIPADST